jgi:APA family basic amino acid/polyamine antiporter
MVGAVVVLRRKRPDAPRPYRTPGYPIVPAVYILLASLLVFDLIYLARLTSGVGFLLVLTGLPVYFLWRRGASKGL